MQNNKWYQNNLAIVGLLVIFFPIGLFLMWKYSKWDKRIKLVITGFFVILILIGASDGGDKTRTQSVNTNPTPTASPTNTPTPVSSKHELDAEIRFSNTAVMITNKEDKEWTYCKFEINSRGFSGGYVYKLNSFQPKDPIVIALREFTKGDGTRFDSYSTKPQNISLSCEVGDQHGFGYYGN